MQAKFARTAVRTVAVGAVAAVGLGSAPAAQAALPPVVQVPCSATALATDISGAVSGETLTLAASCRYVLTAALPDISENLTIDGDEATIERSYALGTPNFSLLTVYLDPSAVNPVDVAVSHLNFRNGNSGTGGAIDAEYGGNSGTVTVTGGTFTGNTAGGDGGAIYISGYGMAGLNRWKQLG